MAPIISVITVNFNNRNGLAHTARSIEVQTIRGDLEWVVQDGASTDGSGAFLASYRSNGPISWVSVSDRNLYHAMNLALGRASGDYVVFLNSGDSFTDPESAARFVQILTSSNAPWGYAGVKRLDSSGVPAGYSLPVPYSYAKQMLGSQILPHQGAIFRRDFCIELGCYDESFGAFADQEFFMRAATRASPVVSVDFVATMEPAGISAGVKPAALSRYYARARRKNGISVLPGKLDRAFGLGLSWYRRGYLGRVLSRLHPTDPVNRTCHPEPPAT